jgi:uncharacterized membrane protein
MRYVLFAIVFYLLFLLVRFILRIIVGITNNGKQKVKSQGKQEQSKIDRTQIEDAEFEELNNKAN